MSALCFLCSTKVIVYVVIHILTYYLIIHVGAKAHLKNKNNKELREKFYPFFRNDLDNWSIVKCFPWYVTFWPRFIAAIFNLMLYGLTV